MSLGFIIVRHVNSPTTNEYWIEAYHCIRRLYPQHWILIVDDDSIQSFIVYHFTMRRCKVISSEFPRAGELLGYYYFYKTQMFTQAVILHDSVFLQRKLPPVKEPVLFLWHFVDPPGHIREEKQWIAKLPKDTFSLLRLYDKKKEWHGCFGVQSVITLEFLQFLEKKYHFLERLLPLVNNRFDRQCMERVFALLCSVECSYLHQHPSLFGEIHHYVVPWGFTFEKYRNSSDAYKKSIPAVKVWTGR